MAGNTRKRPFRWVHVAGGHGGQHGARSQHGVSAAVGGGCPELVGFECGCSDLIVRIGGSLV